MPQFTLEARLINTRYIHHEIRTHRKSPKHPNKHTHRKKRTCKKQHHVVRRRSEAVKVVSSTAADFVLAAAVWLCLRRCRRRRRRRRRSLVVCYAVGIGVDCRRSHTNDVVVSSLNSVQPMRMVRKTRGVRRDVFFVRQPGSPPRWQNGSLERAQRFSTLAQRRFEGAPRARFCVLDRNASRFANACAEQNTCFVDTRSLVVGVFGICVCFGVLNVCDMSLCENCVCVFCHWFLVFNLCVDHKCNDTLYVMYFVFL